MILLVRLVTPSGRGSLESLLLISELGSSHDLNNWEAMLIGTTLPLPRDLCLASDAGVTLGIGRKMPSPFDLNIPGRIGKPQTGLP